MHLVALVAYNVVAGTRPDAPTIAVGGGAYLVMFAMAATSNDASVRRLGRNWLRLHKLGVYWLGFVFTFSYAGRVFGGKPWFAPWFAAAPRSRCASWPHASARRIPADPRLDRRARSADGAAPRYSTPKLASAERTSPWTRP